MHIAIIVSRKGSILSKRMNELLVDGTSLHAETSAIHQLRNKIRSHKIKEKSCARAKMYVFRYSRGGYFQMSRPCIHCQYDIDNCKYIHKVVYSLNDGFAEMTVRRPSCNLR